MNTVVLSLAPSGMYEISSLTTGLSAGSPSQSVTTLNATRTSIPAIRMVSSPNGVGLPSSNICKPTPREIDFSSIMDASLFMLRRVSLSLASKFSALP